MNIYYTYVLIDPVTRQPFYVGKGSKTRIYDHWKHRNSKQVGNKMLKGTLNKIHSLKLKPIYEKVLINVTETEALNKERELIKLYGRRDIKTGILCNLTDGGEDGGSSWSPETREARRQHELAKNKGRPVSQYTLDGVFISDFPSAKRASEHVPSANRSYITQCCKHRRKSAGNFLWVYSGEHPALFSKKYYRPVLQFTQDGIFVQEYMCLTEAAKQVNRDVHTISDACRGKCKTSAGFIWKYKEVSS